MFYSRCSGRFDLEAVGHLMRGFERVAAEGGLVDTFHDWADVESYDAEVRVPYTDWAWAHRQQVASLHILVRSRLLAMGISVANMGLGGMITSYTDRAPFETVRRRLEQTRG